MSGCPKCGEYPKARFKERFHSGRKSGSVCLAWPREQLQMMTFSMKRKNFHLGLTGFVKETFRWGLQSWKSIIHKKKNILFSSADGWQ